MKTAPAAEVAASFEAFLKASKRGPIVVTCGGKPTAVLLAVRDDDDLEELLMAHSPRLQKILKEARARIAAGEGIPNEQFWNDVQSRQKSIPRTSKPTRRRVAKN